MPTPKIGLPLGTREIVMRVQREGAAPSAEGMLALPPCGHSPLAPSAPPLQGVDKGSAPVVYCLMSR